ncbi:hypothetical protein HYDPIDRAFT_118478 [Hydnomerulius pinastri MD-312]|uniref:Mid2 domain-containing protein n=1 Tax=Hydnomerulius pinastri MD-312 TaxID=994086 RepID=A0A0C9VP71_9AGAM|nr:hypothetical protein HYDPIDRAFT_118478 [Hydnomerulius pinastri MD-312]
MSPSPSDNSPWPAQTAPPSISHQRSKRKRQPEEDSHPTPSLVQRQNTIISDANAVNQAKYDCQIYANNNNVTCYPAAGDQVYQHQWAAVVWNSRRPQIDQYNLVNLYLFNADTQEALFSITDYTNPTGTAGQYNLPVNDSWFGEKGTEWTPGTNLSYPFYWIVTDQNGLSGSQTTNPTFYAIQTTYADSVASSISSASLSSLSAQSTLSAASLASAASQASNASSAAASPSGNIQSNQDNGGFPHWAIAVIVVLGFLAIVAGGVLVWLIMRRLRRRERLSNRGSMGSSSPMIANAQNSNSPQLPLLAGAGLVALGGRTSSEHQRPASIVSPDGVSEISRAHSAGDQGPFSGADAAIMADAFRKALRKPDFAGAPVEEAEDRKDDAIMNRELAEEGRDIRSVGSSRGVRVETLSDAGDTVQNH